MSLLEMLVPGKNYKGLIKTFDKNGTKEWSTETVDFTVLKTHNEASVIMLHHLDGEIPKKYNEWKKKIEEYNIEELLDDKPYDDFEKLDNAFAKFYLSYVIPFFYINEELYGLDANDSNKSLRLLNLKES